MPRIASPWPSATEIIRVRLAELPAPLPDRLVGQDDPALGEEFRHVAVAAGEPAGQPDRVRDNLRREAMAFVVGSGWVFFHAPSIAHAPRKAGYLS